MKKILMMCSVTVLALPIFVNAQDSSAAAEILEQMQNESPTVSPINEPVLAPREMNRPAVVPNRQNNVQNRQGAVENRQNIMQDRQNAVQERQNAVQNRQGAVENRQNAIQERQNNIQERQGNMQERRTAAATRFAEVKERVEGKKADIAQRLAERKLNVDERRTRLQENVKERVGALAENVYTRLAAVLQKLNQLSDRLENKISELEAAGSDIGDARALLDSAKGKLIEVGAELEASKATFESLLEDEVSKGDVRSLIEPLKNSLKEAHAELVKVVAELKN